MGNIASPVMGISPMETVKELWGGKLPEFESMDAVNELFNALVAGLWNRLAEHQSSRHPFKLLRFAVAPTREELKQFALFRQQEVDGFVDGLFGPEKEIDLSSRSQKALGVLAEIRAMLVGIMDLLEDLSKPAEPDELKKLSRNIQAITLIAETEMNTTILSCKRARSHLLATIRATKPTMH
jgi:hypothetical protein